MIITTIDELANIFNGYTVIRISIDAEWDWKEWVELEKKRVRPKEILTKQITLETNHGILNFIFWDKSLPLPTECDIPNLYVIKCDVNNTHLGHVISNTKLELFSSEYDKRINILGFYSEVDLCCIMSELEVNTLIKRGKIEKKRNINLMINFNLETGMVKIPDKEDKDTFTSSNSYYKFNDLFGAFNSSLDKAFETVGIEQPYKNLVTKEEKKNMKKVFLEDPNRAIKYAMGDTMYLPDLLNKRVKQINQIVEDSLGINTNFNDSNFPRSSGKLTETVFRKWLAKEYPYLLFKAELLADITSLNSKSFEAFNALNNLSFNGQVVFIGDKIVNIENFALYYWDSEKVITGLAHGSIPAIGTKGIRFGQTLGAIVNGGRCVNENPKRVKLKKVFDIDLKSCYGSSLAKMFYPIGVPSTITGRTETHKECRSLRQMLTIIKQFEPDMWQMIVHTSDDLSFQQDLIFSNPYITASQIKSKIIKQRYDDNENEAEDVLERTHIDGGFCLLNRQIINGIITTSSLEVLKAVSTGKEWSELLDKVKVDLIIGYRTKDKVTVEEYLEKIDNCEKGFKSVNGDSEVDIRSKMWVKVPIKDFIQPFLNLRKKYKKQKEKPGDKWDLLQGGCKLFVNTFYGVMASPYFTTSNAILANNITDRARCGVWKINKALGTNMSITDGGAYQYNDCRIIKPNSSKPGLNAMANYERLDKHKSILKKPILDFDTFYNLCKDSTSVSEKDKKSFYDDISKKGFNGSYSDFCDGIGDLHGNVLDVVSLNWINNFWSVYGLELGFDVEHKGDNTALEMVHFNKSDYMFINPLKPKYKDGIDGVCDKPYSVKVRGAREVNHMKKQFLGYLGGFVDDCARFQISESMYKVNNLKEELNRYGLECILEPGMGILEVYTLKINFNQLPFDTLAQRKYYLDKIQRLDNDLKKAIEPYQKIWAKTGDASVFYNIPEHPIFRDKPPNMSLADYLIDIYLPSGADVNLANKHVKSTNKYVTERLIVHDYFNLVDKGMGKTKAKQEVCKKRKISLTKIKGLISKYKQEFEKVDKTDLLDSEIMTKISNRFRVGTSEQKEDIEYTY